MTGARQITYIQSSSKQLEWKTKKLVSEIRSPKVPHQTPESISPWSIVCSANLLWGDGRPTSKSGNPHTTALCDPFFLGRSNMCPVYIIYDT